MKKIKKIAKWGLIIVLFGVILVFAANYAVENKTKDFVFDDINAIPENRVGLLLGTCESIH